MPQSVYDDLSKEYEAKVKDSAITKYLAQTYDKAWILSANK